MSPESPYPGPTPPGPDDAPVPAAEPGETPTADEAPKAAPTCKVCGCELEPDQTYCLECGTPTPLAPKLRRGVGGLAAVALGLVVLGAGAGALAYVASGDDGQSAGGVAPATTTAPIITVPTDVIPTTTTDSSLPGDTTGTLPTDTSGLFPDTTATVDTTGGLPVDPTATTGDSSGLMTVTGPGVDGQTTSELPTDSGSGINDGTGGSSGGTVTPDDSTGSSSGDWPAGTSGWTAIVSSVRNEASARAAASKLQSQGEPGGVLFSTDHPPLNPGYWVVFSGVYTTKTEALSHARSLLAKWPGAYPRQIDS